LFSERRYIASAPSLSSTAELSKSCGLVGVLNGRVEGARRSQVRAGLEIAPLGRTQSGRCDRERLVPLRPLHPPSEPKQHRDFHQTERKLTTPRSRAIARARKKVV